MDWPIKDDDERREVYSDLSGCLNEINERLEKLEARVVCGDEGHERAPIIVTENGEDSSVLWGCARCGAVWMDREIELARLAKFTPILLTNQSGKPIGGAGMKIVVKPWPGVLPTEGDAE